MVSMILRESFRHHLLVAAGGGSSRVGRYLKGDQSELHDIRTKKDWEIGNIQLLQVTVRNVMTAPVRDSIELDTVGELHIVCGVKPVDLLCPLALPM